MNHVIEQLRAAQRSRATVRIETTDCLYACCAKPPARRAGYLQVYQGRVADVDERRLLLHSMALETLNYHVIAELVNISDVTLVD